MKRSRIELALDRIFDALEADLIATTDAEIDDALKTPNMIPSVSRSLALGEIHLHRPATTAKTEDVEATKVGVHMLRDRVPRDRR